MTNALAVQEPERSTGTDLAVVFDRAAKAASAINSLANVIRTLRQIGRSDDRVAILKAQIDGLRESGSLENILSHVAKLRERATRREIKQELGLLAASFPNAARADTTLFGRILEAEVAIMRPSRGALAAACRELRKTCRFTPTVAEVLEALGREETTFTVRLGDIDALPKTVDWAQKCIAYQAEEKFWADLKFIKIKCDAELYRSGLLGNGEFF
jgi:hypothetical protein